MDCQELCTARVDWVSGRGQAPGGSLAFWQADAGVHLVWWDAGYGALEMKERSF